MIEQFREALTTARFAEPLALVALLAPALVAALLVRATRRRRQALDVLGGAVALHGGASERRRVVVAVLLVVALALAVLAAARPQWGEGERPLTQSGIDLVIALDVSRSMDAEDVPPSRAQAAAAGLGEMLGHLAGNRVGLVTFAGSAFVRAPLTVDLDVLNALVASAQAESPLVLPGTDFASAIDEALDVLDIEDAAATQAIVLVSDGEDMDQGVTGAIERARNADIPVYTVFAGTSDPTALPATGGETDVTTARPEVMEQIAEATGGESREVIQVAGLAVEFRRLQQTQFDSATERQPIDRFPWFAGAALAVLALAMLIGEGGSRCLPRLRGGVITTVPVALAAVILAGCGTAAWRHVDAGNDAYEAARYEDALAEYDQALGALAEDAGERAIVLDNRANALHQLGRYEEAAAAGDEARRLAIEHEDAATALRAQYGLGNTAFVQDELEAARDAYMSALRLDPADLDAKANLELVLALLAPQGEDGPAGSPGADNGAEDGEPSPGSTPGPGPTAAPDGQPGSGEGATPVPSATPGGGGGSGAGDGSTTPPDRETALEAARVDLAQALGDLGDEITPEEAVLILELTRRVNELSGLPAQGGSGVPPR